MMNKMVLAALVAVAPTMVFALSADEVTPDVIFGSGNANGSFTIDQNNGIEIGLRGKLRFNESNSPENTFNWDGGNTYTFEAGTPPSGFSFALNAPTTPIWNFEWSINSNFDGSGGQLGDYNYVLSLGDGNGGALVFDPINLPIADHAFGDNTTGNGNGEVAANQTAYEELLTSKNVAQNSWSYEFFNGPGALENFDPNMVAIYEVMLSAYDKTDEDFSDALASTTIQINVVPVPAALPLLASAIAGFALLRRRQLRSAA